MMRETATPLTDEDTAALEEIDLSEMEAVSGGVCQGCASGAAAGGSSSALRAMIPLLATQGGGR